MSLVISLCSAFVCVGDAAGRHSVGCRCFGLGETGADGRQQIPAIYMCDSDDRTRQLHRIPIRREQGMLAFHCPEHPLYGRLGLVTLDTYTGMRLQPVECD